MFVGLVVLGPWSQSLPERFGFVAVGGVGALRSARVPPSKVSQRQGVVGLVVLGPWSQSLPKRFEFHAAEDKGTLSSARDPTS